MSDRSIYWSVTINNPRDDDEENIAVARQRGWIVEGQKEVGENGTPHYQLMVNTRTQQRFPALKKVFPRAHIELARKPTALKQYVHKVETRVSALPESSRFVTSQTQLWKLVVDVLESADIDKEHRIMIGEDRAYNPDRFDPLASLDYAADTLIRQGYYCVETMVVNPQTRSAFQKFWRSIVARRQLDRQTDRQNEIISQSVNIPIEDGDSESKDEGHTQSECSWEDDEGNDSSSGSSVEADG